MTVATYDRPQSPFAWAAYLGASWTWCIGMFLPVLLIRDYGPWAWVIFAVPNCVGAAAMGWVMRSPEQSRVYVQRHAAAARLFSFVTIAFQMFFAVCILRRLLGNGAYLGAMVIIQLAFTPLGSERRQRAAGVVVLALSVALVTFAGFQGALAWPMPFTPSLGELIGLSAVCTLGFITCPYLDLTFHRARRSTGAAGAKIAFGVGFCGLFGTMIVLTFLYAANFYSVRGIAGVLIGIHVLVQMAYTVNLHATELRHAADDSSDFREFTLMGLALALAFVVALFAGAADQWGHKYGVFAIGEVAYRGFLAFYGLLFPAYVLLAIRRTKVSHVAWMTVTAVGLPFYWIAFIEGKITWGAAGAVVVVVAALIARTITPRVSAARF